MQDDNSTPTPVATYDTAPLTSFETAPVTCPPIEVSLDMAASVNTADKDAVTPGETAHSKHKHHLKHIEHDRALLALRNTFVGVAAFMFIFTFMPESVLAKTTGYIIGGIAYLFGAIAYLMELLMLNDLFRKKVSLEEMLMPYVFGALYVMMGIRYLLR